MSGPAAGGPVVVSAPARLHFGMLDPAGLGIRRFGGFGVGVAEPRVEVAARTGATNGVRCIGPEAERAAGFARLACAAYGLRAPVALEVRRALPAHAGLGSGTKLGLAVARAIAGLAARDADGGAPVAGDPRALAAAAGRGARSSVGAWTFAGPGLVVEAGVSDGDDDAEISPLLMRVAMPRAWRCVLARPRAASGLSGAAEERFFTGIGSGAAEPAVSRRLLTELLPALQAGDVVGFGAALSAIQRDVGALFAAAQGGVFHPAAAPLVDALSAAGVPGVGQSSWGPTVYGIVGSAAEAEAVAGDLRRAFPDAVVTVTDFDRTGAVVTP